MIEIAVMHSFLLVGSRGERTPLLSIEMDDREISDVSTTVATAAVSPMWEPQEHALLKEASARAFAKVETIPGTTATAGERLPGNRLLRVIRHLAGENPED